MKFGGFSALNYSFFFSNCCRRAMRCCEIQEHKAPEAYKQILPKGNKKKGMNLTAVLFPAAW